MLSDPLLRCDYDKQYDAPSDANIHARLERAGYRVLALRWNRSPGGAGWHARIAVAPEPETDMEMVALQAICGSDPYREASNVLRVRQLTKVPEYWRRRWNVLYAAELAPVARQVFNGASTGGENAESKP